MSSDRPVRSHHPTEQCGLLVIGSGPAGVHAAAAYVDAGGAGSVRLISADVDPPYQRPPLSKSVLSGEEPAEVTPILDGSALARVDIRLGLRAEVIDTERRVVRLADGRALAYERLVVATGSTPVGLPGVQPGALVLNLRSLEDGRVLAQEAERADSAVVVGSGFIGCEAAASLAARGVRTTLITPEVVPQAGRLGDEVGARIASWLRSAGVDVRTGLHVETVDPRATVRLDDGSSVVSDLVLAAVGVTQAQGLLESSGLALDKDGRMVVDDRLQAGNQRVWAAGDVALAQHAVAGRALGVEHWGDAVTMGQLAGRNAAAAHGSSGTATWSDPPGFWSEIGGHTLKYSAWGDGYDEARWVDHDDDAFTVWYADSAGDLVGVLTHDRDEDYERGGVLLARHATLDEALDGGAR